MTPPGRHPVMPAKAGIHALSGRATKGLDTRFRGHDGVVFDVLYKHRFKELDGVRGLASLTVGINHSIGAIIAISPAAFGAAALGVAAGILNGALAVDLFFIMSGFFLTGMIERLTLNGWPAFYLRRLARLAPPAMASVILFVFYVRLCLPGQTTHAASATFIGYVHDNLDGSFRYFLLNFALIRHTLNPVLWTIRIEIFASLLFPPLFLIKGLRKNIWYEIAIFPALLSIAIVLRNHQTTGLDVLHYLYIFYAGVLARRFGPRLGQLPAARAVALFGAAGVLMFLSACVIPTDGVHPIGFDLPVTLFGAIILGLLAHGDMPRVRGFMKTAAIQFLGRISYSYYLVNFLFVQGFGGAALNHFLPDRIGPFLAITGLAVASTLAALPFGYLFHIALEQPAVAFSRYLGRKAA